MGNAVKRLSAVSVALAVSVASMTVPAMATPAEAPVVPAEEIFEQPLSEQDIAQAEAALEELFTTIIQEGTDGWTVNAAAAADAGLSIPEAQQVADALNGTVNAPRRVPRHAVDSEEYRRCVLNAVGLGGLTASAAGGGSQLAYLIAARNWKEVAWVLGRLVGVNALRGGVAGATAALAGAGAWCATPWAN